MGVGVACGVDIGVEDDLGNAGVVTKIDENQSSVVASPVHPSHECDVLACMFFAQVAAVMCSRHHVNECRGVIVLRNE